VLLITKQLELTTYPLRVFAPWRLCVK